LDQNVGEFTYKIKGLASEPQITETVVWNINSGGILIKNLRVMQRNALRDKAIYTALSPVCSINPINKIYKKSSKAVKTIGREQYQFTKNLSLRYKIEITCTSLSSVNPEVYIKPNCDSFDSHSMMLDKNMIQIPLVFTTKVYYLII
jgi:hypothetical protein